MKYRVTRAFWLGDYKNGDAEKVDIGDLLDWDGESAAVLNIQQVLSPDKDSFESAIRKGWLELVSEGPGAEEPTGWDDDPLEM